MAATENVKVKVVYCLATVATIINDDAIAVGESGLFCYPFDSQQQVSHESMISRLGIG